MKTNLFNAEGKTEKTIELPKCFSQEIREDIIEKVIETKKTRQPYAPSPVAGKQHSARGKLRHRRHVWKTPYGKGISRVPRKIFSRKGEQFNWEAAEIPFARGGMRAHPPKVIGIINTKSINKKELALALKSAISATANEKSMKKRYHTLKDEKIGNIPFVVEGKILSLKTKQLMGTLKKILGEKMFVLAVRERKIRSGRGKMRGRIHKSNAGMIFVTGKAEKKPKTGAFEIANADNLNTAQLARGGAGRIAMYTESAIRELGEKFGGKKWISNQL